MQTNLVQVQYKSRYGEGYSGRPYTYIADTPLREGDIVTVPTMYGDNEARVCRIDVPEDEVASFRDRLRHITEMPKNTGSEFADFFK